MIEKKDRNFTIDKVDKLLPFNYSENQLQDIQDMLYQLSELLYAMAKDENVQE